LISTLNEVEILVSFDLPSAYVKKIEDVSPKFTVQKSHKKKELLGHIKNAEILFAGVFSLEMFLAARKLKWIQIAGAGADRFLFPEVVNSQVIITNSGDILSNPASEHVIAIMLSFCRKLHSLIINQAEKKWERYGGYLGEQFEELSGKTIGIVGLGRIGEKVAKKAKSLGMKVIATKRNLSAPKPNYIDKLLNRENLRELLKKSDFVVLTVPLTKETEGLIGEAQLRCMKKTSYLINISRGKIVQEDELIKALEEGWIAGAGLDTFEEEPLIQGSKLWDMKNVIITPHVAGISRSFLERLTNVFCQNLKLFLNNETLINIVDKNIGY